jgi:hypothetical protein
MCKIKISPDGTSNFSTIVSSKRDENKSAEFRNAYTLKNGEFGTALAQSIIQTICGDLVTSMDHLNVIDAECGKLCFSFRV